MFFNEDLIKNIFFVKTASHHYTSNMQQIRLQARGSQKHIW